MPRELINTGNTKLYVTRRPDGRFKTVVAVGASLRQDVKQRAKTVVKPGYGHRGDQKRRGGRRAGRAKR